MTFVLTTLLSGVLFYFSQGLNNLWILAWIAPAPILWFAYGRAPTWQVLLGSLAAFSAGQIYAIQCYGDLPAPLALSTFVPLAILFPAAIGFARYAQQRLTQAATLFAFPACWTAFEYLIGLASPNGSFGALAYSQMSAPVLVQSASLFGMYCVTFLICLFANTVALTVRGRHGWRTVAALGFIICGLNVAFGLVRLAQPHAEKINVAALVDEGVTTEARKFNTLTSAVSASGTYANAIRVVAAKGATFVVMPEGGLTSRAGWGDAVLAPIVDASKQTGTQIVAGVLDRSPPGDLAFFISPNGVVLSYAKRHPVPFLETRFTPGHDSGELGGGRAMAICKDMDFPRTIRHEAGDNVRLMAVPAGDFVYDGWLHGRMAIMRGVENGFAVVRAANKGLLTASDAEGRIISDKAATPSGMTSMTATLPLGSGPTLSTDIGDAFPWFDVALTIAIGGFSFWSKQSANMKSGVAEAERNSVTTRS